MTLAARISKLVADVIRQNTGRSLQLTPDEPLISSGYLDSMSMVSLVIALQGEFDVQFAVADMSAENFETVSAIVKLIEPTG